jgi:flagellar basal-body rod protein FlgB
MGNISTLQQLQGFLQVTSERQQMVTANIANVDTPGYHTHDINFQQAMQEVVSRGTEPHLAQANLELSGLPERPDGNNVNIDRESMLLSETQLQHQVGVQLIKEEFHRLLTAIKD